MKKRYIWIRNIRLGISRRKQKYLYSRKTALIVQNVNDSVGLFRDQINARLVICVIDYFPADLLFSVLFLLQLKYVLVEIELKRLICIVNAQLFEAVRWEVLKFMKIISGMNRINENERKNIPYLESKDVKNGNRIFLVSLFAYYVVYSLDEPSEQSWIDGFGNRIPTLFFSRNKSIVKEKKMKIRFETKFVFVTSHPMLDQCWMVTIVFRRELPLSYALAFVWARAHLCQANMNSI